MQRVNMQLDVRGELRFANLLSSNNHFKVPTTSLALIDSKQVGSCSQQQIWMDTATKDFTKNVRGKSC